MVSELKKLQCGRKFRKRMESIAPIDILPEYGPEAAGDAYFSTVEELYICAGVEGSKLDLSFLAVEQYPRWRSFWQFVLAADVMDSNRKLAEHLLADLEESYGVHAKIHKIVKDYGKAKAVLLHSLAKRSLEALKRGNTGIARRFAERGADTQYWLAMERIDKGSPD